MKPSPPLPFELVVREGDELFPLTERGGYVLLADDGFFTHTQRSASGAHFVPYEDITHVVAARRGVWVGLRRSVIALSRGRRTKLDVPALARAIERRVARRPGGGAQLALFRENDARMRRSRGIRVSIVFAIAWLGMHLLQVGDGFVESSGMFAGGLARDGEWWRFATAHFLHQVGLPHPASFESPFAQSLWLWIWRSLGRLAELAPLHLATNAALLLLFGTIVEQPLGARRTIVVLGSAGLAAALASAAVGERMIGGSGLVLGLAGAALALELTVPERVPAPWRIPRRIFLPVLALEALFGFSTPVIAGFAHAGGFAGGYLAGRAMARQAVFDRPPTRWLRAGSAAVVVAVAAAFASATPLVLRWPRALVRHAERVLAQDDATAGDLNDLAWRIATESDALAGAGARASTLALAERAVEETERANPDFLDTLAEVHFQSGDRDGALAAIDEAIEIAPWDPYFREQRDRFTGVRAADDRPVSPPLPWFLRSPPAPAPWDEGDGIAI